MHGINLDNGQGTMTLADLLSQRAGKYPDRVAFVYEEQDGQTRQWTYRDLDLRARAIAASLLERTTVGDRAMLVYPAGLDFIAAYFGCVYAGVLPVPATYPKPRRPLPRLDAIVADCSPRLVLTHSSVLGGMCLEKQSPALAALGWEATDKIGSPPGDFQTRKRQPHDLAFLQYTSGSTSEPRGVMVSHENLLSNLEAIRAGFEIPIEDQCGDPTKGVFWLPAYHDMGLIGSILSPIYVAGTSYLFAPTTFLRRPQRWLELISQTGAAFNGAPNFGYELVVQKTTAAERAALNLENWKLAFCGAEPIHPETLEQFASAFAPAKFNPSSFYPCYGLAEVTLLATGGQGAAEPQVLHVDRQQLAAHQAASVSRDHPQAMPLVSCGSARNGLNVEIVDPKSRHVCETGRVGEIWVRGTSVARGYWNQDELNQEIFQAQLANGQASSNGSGERFLRTGDLGFQLDGQLYVTGRLKDVIIIRGRNYYPHDIERTAKLSHEAVDLGVAFSLEVDDREQLVVVHQTNREHRRADFDEVLRTIRTAIVNEHEIDPHAILLIRPVSLPITSSGKVQRQRCREQYLAGELSVSAEWTNSHDVPEPSDPILLVRPDFLDGLSDATEDRLSLEVQEWLVQWLTARASLMPGAMGPTTPFAELGIDSLTAVEISLEIDNLLGLQSPPMVIWSRPHVESLSAYLAQQLLAPATPTSAANGTAPQVTGPLQEKV
jgi:acyl-CoA synthetase (AMP-forming)/AMP-acid ligase II/acyl carrier protein